MFIHSSYNFPKTRERDRKFKAFILVWIMLAILSMLYLATAITSWRETSKAWAEEDKASLPGRYNLQIESF